MEGIEKIKTSSINLEVRTSSALIVEIDSFKFTNQTGLDFVVVEFDKNGEPEYLDTVYLEEDDCFDEFDLERLALNWIFKHVELVRPEEIERMVDKFKED